MNIIIHPYSARLHNGAPNAKNYPYWEEVVTRLNVLGYEVIQIGGKGEDRINGVGQFIVGWPLKKLKDIVDRASTFIAVDSFFPHFVHVECGGKRGVVLWGKSDPSIWGHAENLNLAGDPKHFRQFQYAPWTDAEFDPYVFVSPDDVVAAVQILAPIHANAYRTQAA